MKQASLAFPLLFTLLISSQLLAQDAVIDKANRQNNIQESKQAQLRTIDKRMARLQQLKSCIQSASNQTQIKQCRTQSQDEIKQQRKAKKERHEERKDQRSDKIQTRIEKLQAQQKKLNSQ